MKKQKEEQEMERKMKMRSRMDKETGRWSGSIHGTTTDAYNLSIADILAEYPNSIDGEGSKALPESVYHIPKALKKYLREELAFAFYGFEFESLGDSCICRTDCPPEYFKRLFQRSMCAKMTTEQGRLIVTEAEKENPDVMQFLQKIYQIEEYDILQEDELPAYEILNDGGAVANTYWYPLDEMSGTSCLQRELEIRNYQAEVFETADGLYCAVKNCPQHQFIQIFNRARCMSESGSIFCLTKQESCDSYMRAILEKRYHFMANVILEDVLQVKGGEDDR